MYFSLKNICSIFSFLFCLMLFSQDSGFKYQTYQDNGNEMGYRTLLPKKYDENKQYPLLVISIDEDKGYIDLSNKFVSDDDKNDSLEKYELYLKVLKIFNNFIYSKFKSEFTEQDLVNYAEKTIWTIDKTKCYKYFSLSTLMQLYGHRCLLQFLLAIL